MPLHDPPLYGARAGKENGDLYKAPSPGRRFPQGEPSCRGYKGNRAGFSVCAGPVPAGAKPVNDASQCVYCTLCAKKCPQEAIQVERASKTWKLDGEKCIGCGLCAASCPKKCLKMQ